MSKLEFDLPRFDSPCLQDGIPRGGYNGVVIVRWEQCRLLFSQALEFVAPEKTVTIAKVDQSGALIRTKIKPVS